MKCLLPLLCLLANTTVCGQGKIKMEITAAGDTLYSTGDKKIYAAPGARNAIGEMVKSTVYKSGNGFSLCLQIETGRTGVFTIGRNDAAEMTLADGSTLTLYPKTNNASHRSALNYGCYIFVFYALNGEALSGLRSQNLKKILVATSFGRMEYEIKDKQADAVRKQVASFD